MSRTAFVIIGILGVAGLAAFVGWRYLVPSRAAEKAASPVAASSPGANNAPPVATPGVPAKVSPPPVRSPGFAKLSPAAQTVYVAIESALEDLKSDQPARVKAAMAKLNSVLAGPNHAAAASIAAIREFLKTGQDAPTGDEFEVGENGALSTANSLRVDLLDQLGSLCRETGTTEALDVANEILSQYGSADEWAVCLRNTAWLDATSNPLLAQKVEEMFGHQPWLENPTTGFLEAFDVAAYASATNLIPRMNEFLNGGDQSTLWRASTVGLDQLATTHPGDVLDWMSTHPDAMSDHPFQRADLLSKADLADPKQRQLIESYLARADVSVEERAKLVAGLLSPGNFVSNNLLTTVPNVTQDTERQRLETIHNVSQQWQTAGKFPDLAGAISRVVEISSHRPE